MKEAVEERPRRSRNRDATGGRGDRPTLVLYTIAHRLHSGTELFRFGSSVDGDTLPVFSSRAAAEGSLASVLGDGEWCVRESYAGELVSLLLGLYPGVEWVAVDPPPGDLAAGEAPANPVRYKSFVNDLLEQRCGPREGP